VSSFAAQLPIRVVLSLLEELADSRRYPNQISAHLQELVSSFTLSSRRRIDKTVLFVMHD